MSLSIRSLKSPSICNLMEGFDHSIKVLLFKVIELDHMHDVKIKMEQSDKLKEDHSKQRPSQE